MKKSFIYINIAVLLFGLAGVFSKMIGLPSILITFGRVSISSIFLFIYIKLANKDMTLSKYKYLIFLAGIILALHWTTFIESIHQSTVAIGTITFSTFPLFVMLFEIVFFKEKMHIKHLFCILLIIIGVYITIPIFTFDNSMVKGICIGMISSVSYAVLTIINKIVSKEYESTIITFYEQFLASVILVPSLFIVPFTMTFKDGILLFILGIGMTALAHTLFVESLKKLPAGLAGILSCNEMVYSIVFAFLLLKEVPSFREIIGGCLIFVVSIYSQISTNSQ
ncbi:MAG: EamA family transporter [Holdemanella sp.]|nr:EamA family transporter [Holdemanella sp.]